MRLLILPQRAPNAEPQGLVPAAFAFAAVCDLLATGARRRWLPQCWRGPTISNTNRCMAEDEQTNQRLTAILAFAFVQQAGFV